MWYTYLIPPVVGAIIGYCTNEIAITMLFRPHKPKYFLGLRIPFTPGIIPKEKSRIAASLGDAVSMHLMDRKTLSKTLLSDEMIEKVNLGFDSFVNKLKTTDVSLREYLLQYVSNEDVDMVIGRSVNEFSNRVGMIIAEHNVSQGISRKVVEYAVEQTGRGVLGFLQTDKILDKLSAPIERKLAMHLDNILEENASDIILKMLDLEVEKCMDCSVSSLLVGKDDLVEKVKEAVVSVYREIINNQLPRILESVDIKKIVEDRINEMDMAETERITYSVLHKELKAIVWLGALLGGLLGLVNLLFL